MKRRGMTLIEVLGALGIMLCLLALLVNFWSGGRKSSLLHLTASELSGLKLAVLKYQDLEKSLPPDGIVPLMGALSPKGLYPFAQARVIRPGYVEANKARLRESLASLEARTAQVNEEMTGLQQAIATGIGAGQPDGGGGDTAGAGGNIAQARAEAVARSVLHIQGSAADAAEDHARYGELLARENRLLWYQTRRDLYPREKAELEGLQAGLAEYRKDFAEASRLTGLDAPDVSTRLRDTIGRSDYLVKKWGEKVCEDPGLAFSYLKGVTMDNRKSQVYSIKAAARSNRTVTEEMIEETLDILRDVEKRWGERFGDEPWKIARDQTAYGCAKLGLKELYNGTNPELQEIYDEIEYTRFVEGQTLREIEELYETTGDEMYERILADGEGREYDAWDHVATPCLKKLIKEKTYEVQPEYLDRYIEDRFPNPPYPGEAGAGENGGPIVLTRPEYRRLDELGAELTRLRTEAYQTERALYAVEEERQYLDAWGNAFAYEEIRQSGAAEGPVASADESFIIYSAGPDGVYHNGDDLYAK